MKNVLMSLAAVTAFSAWNANAEIPKMEGSLISKKTHQILWIPDYSPKKPQSIDIFDTVPNKKIKKDLSREERDRAFSEYSNNFLELIDIWFLQSSNSKLPLVWFYQNHKNISKITTRADLISSNSQEILQNLFWKILDIYSEKVSQRWNEENYQKEHDFSIEKPEIFLHMEYTWMSLWEWSIFFISIHPENISLPGWETHLLMIEVNWNQVSISHWEFTDEIIFYMK